MYFFIQKYQNVFYSKVSKRIIICIKTYFYEYQNVFFTFPLITLVPPVFIGFVAIFLPLKILP